MDSVRPRGLGCRKGYYNAYTKSMDLPQQTAAMIRAVTEVVSPVYLVGGSVRDILLGRVPHDYDFASPLSPDELEAAVRKSGRRPHLIGKRFGTVGFMCDGQLVEVTTFRKETYSPGSRRPDVAFINDITHDLSRRDFTINAMALRPDGTLIDPFGGREDISRRSIRTVNKPFERFNEDPLRMLRAARFVAQLGFTPDPETEHSAAKKAAKVLEVSKERWTAELDRLVTSDHAAEGLDFLARTRLLAYLLPELAVQVGYNQNSPYHELNLWEHTLKTVRLTKSDVTLRWAALLHDIGKPYAQVKNSRGYSNYMQHDAIGAELVQKIGPYLKWPSSRTKEVADIIAHHLEESSPLHDADSAARFKG